LLSTPIQNFNTAFISRVSRIGKYIAKIYFVVMNKNFVRSKKKLVMYHWTINYFCLFRFYEFFYTSRNHSTFFLYVFYILEKIFQNIVYSEWLFFLNCIKWIYGSNHEKIHGFWSKYCLKRTLNKMIDKKTQTKKSRSNKS